MILKSKLFLGLLVAGMAVAAVIAMQQVAYAVTAGWGYFENRSASGTLSSFSACGVSARAWHRVLCGGIGDYSGNVEGFIADIEGKLGSGDSHVRLGASFIIHTMLGHDPGASRTPSAGDVDEWKARLRAPGISITRRNVTTYPNSAYVRYASDGTYDMAYVDDWADDVDTLVFKSGTDEVYYLKLECANPIGDMPGLPDAATWDASGEAFVNGAKDITAFPGETVQFTYRLYSIGTAPIPSIDWETSGGSSGTVNNVAAGGSRALPTAAPGYESYTIPVVAPGTKICRHMWHPDSQLDDSDEDSNDACVTVKSNYDAFPQTPQAQTPEPLMVGDTRTDIKGYVWNNGTTADRDIPYEIHQFVVTGASKPVFDNTKFPLSTTTAGTTVIYAEGNHNNGAACSAWMRTNFPMITCGAAPLATGTSKFPGGQSPALPGFSNINADLYKPGDWICQFLSIGLYRYNIASVTAHRIGKPLCVVIAKQPALQVWGSDARVGNGIVSKNDDSSVLTSTFSSGGALYGSWAEYGIFSPRNATNTLGKIESVSGGAISGAGGLTTAPTPGHLSRLSFANINSPYGRWAPAQLVASIKQAVQVQSYPILDASGASINLWADNLTVKGKLNVAKLSHVDGSGNPAKVSIRGVNTGGTKFSLPQGGSLLMYSEDSVTVDSDIILKEQTVTQLGTASQVIIVAKNIIIDSDVKKLDAWLIAIPAADGSGGTITTCDTIADTSAGQYYFNGLKLGDDCEKNPLRINGAVIAKELQLRRSYGADKIKGLSQPAETINLRPDAYMWGMLPFNAPVTTGLPITTMITTELPPRF